MKNFLNLYISKISKSAALISMLVTSTVVTAALTCSSTSKIDPAIFSVFAAGKITFDGTYANSTSSCNITFGNNTKNVNAPTTKFYNPDKSCPVTASNLTLPKKVLPVQPVYPTTPVINIVNANWSGDKLSDGLSINNKQYFHCTKNGVTGWITSPINCGQAAPYSFITVVDGVLTLPTPGTKEFFTLSGDLKSLTGGNVRINIPDGRIMGTMTVTNQSQLRLFGDFFINKLVLNDTFEMKVDNSVAKAHIYANIFQIPQGNQACINFVGDCYNPNLSAGTAQSVFNNQTPERLSINIYTGNFNISTMKISASIYVDNGNLTFDVNSGNMFVGEAVANNISTTNTAYLAYKDTGDFADLLDNGSATVAAPIVDFYSLARPAASNSARTGDLMYLAYQEDQTSTTTPAQKHIGTLKSFALAASGATATAATWDANDRATVLGGSPHRQARLYSNSAPDINNMGTFSLINVDPVLDAAAKLRLINGPGATLSSTWSGFYGKPGTTAPQISGNIVLFTASDGFLYALDKATGDLRWGWMPDVLRSSFATLAAYTLSIQTTNYDMQGQLSIATIGGVKYVLGTAQQGKLHYSLKLTASGDLDKVVWIDQRTTGAAPANAIEAPAIMGSNAMYLTNDNRLIVRSITSTASPSTDVTNHGFTITSDTTVVKNDSGNYTLYVGDIVGNVRSATVSASGTMAANPWATLGTSPALMEVSPVNYVVYTRTIDAQYLTLQSSLRITTLKLIGADWREIWTSTRDVSSQWTWKSGSKVNVTGAAMVIPTLPTDGNITDRSTSAGGFILAPVTLPSLTSCLGEARMYKFPLDPEITYYKVFYNNSEMTSSYITIGYGKALQSKALYLNGTLIAQGHSNQNSTTNVQGLDNTLVFRVVAPNTGPGRRSWHEVIQS